MWVGLIPPHLVFGAYNNPVRYRAKLSFSVINDSCDVKQLEIWLPKILQWENQKDIRIHRITPAVEIDTFDQERLNGIYYWKFENNPLEGSTLTVSVDFSFTCYETNFQVDPQQVGSYDTESDLYRKYTQSEPYIEAGDERIRKVAHQIVGREQNYYLKARKIYDWVLQHLDYRFVPGLKGALYALEHRHGECGDYSALFVALCRAVGIPSRPVIGMWATPFHEPHVWAEFYLPRYGWVPVDASHADGWGQTDYYFGNLDNRRVTFSKGYNIRLNLEIPIETLPLFQLGAWWFEGEETGISDRISFSIAGKQIAVNEAHQLYSNETCGLELRLPINWEITNQGGTERYAFCLEMWNNHRDSRIYLYAREWRENEPKRTPAEITEKDIDFFRKNSPHFILLHQGPEKFRNLTGYGFLALMSSYGIGNHYSRYVYFTKEDLIFWLILQSTAENFECDNSDFIKMGNNLRIIKK
ncbi:MAG: hypothetical protein Kow0042_19200 [Calditrichia bacterium]